MVYDLFNVLLNSVCNRLIDASIFIKEIAVEVFFSVSSFYSFGIRVILAS
jgi:hypothetical protein